MTVVCDKFTGIMGDGRGLANTDANSSEAPVLFSLYTREDVGGSGPENTTEVTDLQAFWDEQVQFDDAEDVMDHILGPLARGEDAEWAGNEYTPEDPRLLATLLTGLRR